MDGQPIGLRLINRSRSNSIPTEPVRPPGPAVARRDTGAPGSEGLFREIENPVGRTAAGPEIEPEPDADEQTKLLNFMGRRA